MDRHRPLRALEPLRNVGMMISNPLPWPGWKSLQGHSKRYDDPLIIWLVTQYPFEWHYQQARGFTITHQFIPDLPHHPVNHQSRRGQTGR